MVNPILIIAIGLGAAFALGIIRGGGNRPAHWFTLAALGAMLLISLQWVHGFLFAGLSTVPVFTAGFKPPLSIVLQMGPVEALLTLLINLVGLMTAMHMTRQLRRTGSGAMAVLLLLIMGLNGIVLTRDIFNFFVFLEISALATAGLIALDDHVNSLGAGLRYMIAAGIISGLLLLGIAFLYHHTGTLTLDAISAEAAGKGGLVAFFLVIMALLLELKSFPANGWALDVYERAHPAVSAVLSGASAMAVLFALDKILAVAGPTWYGVCAVAGMLSFLGANLLALRQSSTRRMLGYSSVAQIGLMVTVLGFKPELGDAYLPVMGGLVITHLFAKAGLFYLSGLFSSEGTERWARLKKSPVLLFMAGTFVFALAGFPPFPGFFAKWKLVLHLADNSHLVWVGLILLGSILEAVYLFRWLGMMVKGEEADETLSFSTGKLAPVVICTLALYAAGVISGLVAGITLGWGHALAVLALVFFFLDWLPAKVKNALAIAALGGWAWLMVPEMTEFRMVFTIVFIGGGALTLLAGFAFSGRRVGFYPSAMLMYAGLAMLLEARDLFNLLVAWELMTAGSYFLIIRGKKSQPHALSYMLFSLGGAYLLLMASGLVNTALGTTALDQLGNLPVEISGLVMVLMTLAFLTKTAAVPLHIWLPGAHSEAESDVSPMVSAILLKAGVYGLVLTLLPLGKATLAGLDLAWILGWLGAITAVLGNMMAIYQEDAKRLLAYSSVGQLGYVLFAMSMMSHLGWLTAMSFAVNHFIFKALLFLAIGGVVMRTHTRDMYRMGGLIQRMPFSFISVLIGIITLSGVPPLSGFAGKWLSYNAILEKGWYLQGALIMFAGVVAFLYCFRLIHTIFLGQLKDEHRHLREAPFWMLVPQYLLIMLIMGFSMVPNTVLRPVGRFLVKHFPENAISWSQTSGTSLFGYWNGLYVMYVSGSVFALVFIWLLFINRRAQKVKQFNIVYAAERPSRPELTHYAYNFFAHYRKALGFLVTPYATRFWDLVTEGLHSAAEFLRRIYSGNGQHYAIHMVLFVVVFYLFLRGG
jgi:formate hydrogenlyase subunit 3/multisubunit Na+/H+ antiporter MnhD subunit